MNAIRQIAIVSLLNFRNLRQRFWQSLVIVAGMACVSGVLLSLLSTTLAFNALGNLLPLYAIR